MGVPYKMPVTRLRETVEALRAAFTGQKVTMTGKTVHINGFRLSGPVEPPPPIYVGAQGPLMLRTAGEIGDGVIVNYITPETFAPMLEHIHEGARSAGKPTDKIDIACRILVAIDPEEEIVRENLRRELTAYVTVPQYNKFFRGIGFENEARRGVRSVERWRPQEGAAVDTAEHGGFDLRAGIARSHCEAPARIRKGRHHDQHASVHVVRTGSCGAPHAHFEGNRNAGFELVRAGTRTDPGRAQMETPRRDGGAFCLMRQINSVA